ncbi:MAG: hypothetical protein N2749_04180 [Clostridia bacterium]|nr:hypothetical protein [Clostridia bacterium]
MPGRAGRGCKKGRVVIETSDPDNYILKSVINHDYVEFYNQEIDIRQKYEYPPFIDILLVELISDNIKMLKTEAEILYNVLNDKENVQNNLYKVFSPKSPYIEKVNNKYRINIIIKCKISNVFLKKLYEKLNSYDKIRKKQVNITITKNPTFM